MNKTTQHYEDNYEEYFHSWSREHLHYGYYFDGDESLDTALQNHTMEISELLEINPEDLVLDAGCGTGGSACYIAENIGARVLGIDLSPALIDVALAWSENIAQKELLDYKLLDFADSGLGDEGFTKILSVESLCHVDSKERFLEEAYRLLKKEGRLAVSDFFLTKDNLDEAEQKVYNEWRDGRCVTNLVTHVEFQGMLRRAGFRDVQYFNKTPLILKGSRMLHEAARQNLLENFRGSISEELPSSRMPFFVANVRQWECLAKKIWEQGVYLALK